MKKKQSKTRWLLLGCSVLTTLAVLCTCAALVVRIINPGTRTIEETPASNPTEILTPTHTPVPMDAPIPATPIDAPTPLSPTNTPVAMRCPDGCIEQLSGCEIKGNISDTGEKIYHMPGGQYYEKTKITPRKGERWFCTEEEAQAAGWRKSRR